MAASSSRQPKAQVPGIVAAELGDSSGPLDASAAGKRKKTKKIKKTGSLGTLGRAATTDSFGRNSKDTAETAPEQEDELTQLQRRMEAMTQSLKVHEATLKERDRALFLLQQQLGDEQERSTALVRQGAQSLLCVSELERELESARSQQVPPSIAPPRFRMGLALLHAWHGLTPRIRSSFVVLLFFSLQATVEEELQLQTRMLDALLGFRDKEVTREMHELMHQKIVLRDKADKWKRRARTLEAERKCFVERWRDERKAARAAAVARGEVEPASDADEREAAMVDLVELDKLDGNGELEREVWREAGETQAVQTRESLWEGEVGDEGAMAGTTMEKDSLGTRTGSPTGIGDA